MKPTGADSAQPPVRSRVVGVVRMSPRCRAQYRSAIAVSFAVYAAQSTSGTLSPSDLHPTAPSICSRRMSAWPARWVTSPVTCTMTRWEGDVLVPRSPPRDLAGRVEREKRRWSRRRRPTPVGRGRRCLPPSRHGWRTSRPAGRSRSPPRTRPPRGWPLPPEGRTEAAHLHVEAVLDDAEQVRARRCPGQPQVPLAGPVELPQQCFARLLEVMTQHRLGVVQIRHALHLCATCVGAERLIVARWRPQAPAMGYHGGRACTAARRGAPCSTGPLRRGVTAAPCCTAEGPVPPTWTPRAHQHSSDRGATAPGAPVSPRAACSSPTCSEVAAGTVASPA